MTSAAPPPRIPSQAVTPASRRQPQNSRRRSTPCARGCTSLRSPRPLLPRTRPPRIRSARSQPKNHLPEVGAPPAPQQPPPQKRLSAARPGEGVANSASSTFPHRNRLRSSRGRARESNRRPSPQRPNPLPRPAHLPRAHRSPSVTTPALLQVRPTPTSETPRSRYMHRVHSRSATSPGGPNALHLKLSPGPRLRHHPRRASWRSATQQLCRHRNLRCPRSRPRPRRPRHLSPP